VGSSRRRRLSLGDDSLNMRHLVGRREEACAFFPPAALASTTSDLPLAKILQRTTATGAADDRGLQATRQWNLR
jgi:hypothetical protein